MEGLISYVPGKSLLHQLNPVTKLFMALLFCAACFVSQNHLFILCLIGAIVMAAYASGIGERAAQLLEALVKLSMVLFFLQLFFVQDGTILIDLPGSLAVTDKGLAFSSLLVLRLIGATFPLMIMLSVTSVTDLSNALVEKLGLPYRYVFILITMVRFIPVFTKDMREIMDVQTARGVEFDTKNIFRKVKLILPLCVPLLISSVRRMHTNAISAELRGFNCRGRYSGFRTSSLGGMDVFAGLLGLAVVAAGVVF